MEKNQAQGQTPEQSAQEYNQLVAVRRQNLADLQQAGNDPFVLTKSIRISICFEGKI